MNCALNVEPDSLTANGHDRSTADRSLLVSAAEGYERWAPIYDHAPNPLLAREERYLLPLLAHIDGKSVLDLACGTGRWLEHLFARDCKRGVGVDCSIAMLRVAGRKNPLRKRLAGADCASLPFSSPAFDLAICSFALGHIGDLETVVRELARVTRPAADVFVSDLHPEAYVRGWRVGFRSGGTSVQIETRSWSVEEIIEAFCSNGFECQKHTSLWLGEPEQALFERAGKLRSFADACQLPAVFVCHFRRRRAEAQL